MTGSGFLPRKNFQQLFDVLQQQGFRCIGPRVVDDAIVYTDIDSSDDLSRGIEVEQQPGRYALSQHNHQRQFAWSNSAQALKPLTFASREILWQCHKDSQGNLSFEQHQPAVDNIAFIGARACDLAAFRLQQQHFLKPQATDPWFKQRMSHMLIVAVHCSHASATCFCSNTGDGPEVEQNFDIAMHELDDGFIVQAGSYNGEKILALLQLDAISDEQTQQAEQQLAQCASQQTRQLPDQVQHRLLTQLDNAHWQQIGERCLSCGNCTAVCPTCFCHQQHDELSMPDDTGIHFRQWSSCFTHNHSYISGHSFRPDSASRYRQWATHKFANWFEQYGRSGCVGCGRCISWCPVGIDVTAELQQLCGDAS